MKKEQNSFSTLIRMRALERMPIPYAGERAQRSSDLSAGAHQQQEERQRKIVKGKIIVLYVN